MLEGEPAMTDHHGTKSDAIEQERTDLKSAKDAVEKARESGDAQALEQAREQRHHLKGEIRGERGGSDQKP